MRNFYEHKNKKTNEQKKEGDTNNANLTENHESIEVFTVSAGNFSLE